MKRTLVFAIAALVGLSACSGIPTSGPVNAGDIINDTVDPVQVFLPRDPQVGSSPDELLRDFLQAATSPQDDYAIARKFLAAPIRTSWQPNAGVTIRTGPVDPIEEDESTLVYPIVTSAHIDGTGRYTEDAPDGPSDELRFRFVKEDGEWRISELDPGIVLSEDNFRTVFGAYPLYFFDPTYTYLVPDVRWLPTTNQVPQRITEALLAGPSPWLAGVVATAFAPGTKAGDPVSVESGIARVDLSTEARDADGPARNRMRQQLKASFANVQTVTSVTLSAGGVDLQVNEAGAAQAIVQPSVNALPLVREGDGFGFATAQGITDVPGVSASVIAADAKGATIAGSVTAVRSAAGVSIINGSSAAQLIDPRPGLIDPAVDNFGYVWSAQGDRVDSIRAFDPDGAAQKVTMSFDPGSRLISMNVSGDGTRLLLYLSTDAGPVLGVAGIAREGSLPKLLGEFVSFPVADATPVDATWVDNNTVAALYGGADSRVTVFPIGAPSFTLGSLSNGLSIASVGDGGSDNLRVLAADGLVYRPRGAGWQSTEVSASFLGTQQPG